MRSRSRRSMPIVIVVVDDGHDPQAPLSLSLMVGPSISTNSTLPPSAIRYGRTCTQRGNGFTHFATQFKGI